MMMMTKVWPIATAKSGQTLESWLLMLRAVTRSGNEHRHREEIDDGQVEDEVLGDENPAHDSRMRRRRGAPRPWLQRQIRRYRRGPLHRSSRLHRQ